MAKAKPTTAAADQKAAGAATAEDVSTAAAQAETIGEQVEKPAVDPTLGRIVIYVGAQRSFAAVVSDVYEGSHKVHLSVFGPLGGFVKDEVAYSAEGKVGTWHYPVIKK